MSVVEPPVERCQAKSGCPAAQLEGAHCLEHLTEQELEVVGARLRAGEPLDARNTTISAERLQALLKALRREDLPVLPDARFDGATFSDDARFDGATFSGYARFDGATFNGHAAFNGATFSGYAAFIAATFNGAARSVEATFSHDTAFDAATFSGDTDFDKDLHDDVDLGELADEDLDVDEDLHDHEGGGIVMANREHITLTDEERADRRKREQQLTEQAVAQLRSSAGWQRWLTLRARFGLRRLSIRNQLLRCLVGRTPVQAQPLNLATMLASAFGRRGGAGASARSPLVAVAVA
jgi:hypothetical protein